jgi:hypothetical protein
MDNLDLLLTPPVPAQQTKSALSSPSPSGRVGEGLSDYEIMISAKLDFQLVEYIRDFQNHEALRTGNLHFSLKDALTSIIVSHKEQNPNIAPRPASIKAAERKRGRRKL